MRRTNYRKLLQQVAKWLLGACLLLGLILLGTLLYFQTPSGKKAVAKQIETQIHHLSSDAEVSTLQGHFPWVWEINKISGSIPETCDFTIENCKFRLHVFSLLFGSPWLSSVTIEKVNIAFYESTEEMDAKPHLKVVSLLQEKSKLPSFVLPSFVIDHFTIQNCTFSKLGSKERGSLEPSSLEPCSYGFEGGVDFRPEERKVSLELTALNPLLRTKVWKIDIDLLKQEKLQEKLRLELKTFAPLDKDFGALFSLPQKLNHFLFDLHLEGPLTTISAIINPPAFLPTSPPISLQYRAYDPLEKDSQMRLRMFMHPDRSMEISQLDVHLPFLQLAGHGKLGPDFHPEQGFLEFDFRGSYNPAPGCMIAIPLQGQIEINNHELLARGSAKEWIIEDYTFQEILFSAKANHGLFWQGNFALLANGERDRLYSSSEFTYDASVLKLEGLRLELPSLVVESEAAINLHTWISQIYLFAQTDALTQIPCSSLLPLEAGKAALTVNLYPLGNTQAINWVIKAEEGSFSLPESILFGEIECKGLQEFASPFSFADLKKPWDTSWDGNLQVEGKKIYWKWNFFESLDWHMEKSPRGYLHEVHTHGVSKKPFYLNVQGFYQDKNGEKTLTMEELDGSWNKLPINLLHPCTMNLKSSEFSLDHLDLKLGGGSLIASLLFTDNFCEAKVKTSHLPLSPFSCLSQDMSLEGAISSEWICTGSQKSPAGHAWIELEPTAIRLDEGNEQVVGKGSIQLFLDNEQLQGHINFLSAFGQYLEGQISVPLKTAPSILDWRIAEDKLLAARVRVEGKIEELVPFLTFDAHRLEGKLDADLFISKTLQSPVVQGYVAVENGLYENISYGSHLKNISIKAIADRDRFIIEEGMGIDGKGGSLSMNGHIILSPSLHYPLEFLGSLQQLEIIKSDFAEAIVTGDLRYAGSLVNAKLSGTLHSEKMELKIPDTITEPIPHVDVEFIRLPSRRLSKTLPKPKKDIVHLDLELLLKDKIFVSGRGLSSEWKGNLKVLGTADNILPTGSLDLLRGKFLFSGKTFTLSEGRIVFNGKELTPDIMLEGTLGMSDLSVTVLLQGPLDAPQLSFQSIPHLPTSSLLSRLLFNKDVSEINPVQAYQLAETLMSLSGSGVNILEAIQKSLGIDKLSIVSGNNRFDEVSLQIGKYLYKGVMITLSQSASSSEIMVEVELKKGFIFQAETVEDDGKFTLKWNYNY